MLGKECMDIDIALDTMMGVDFAKLVQQVSTEGGSTPTKGFGVIKANPEKSKHLETATLNLEGRWIDFVNLRKEEYAANSRIPTMAFGTPLEDAERRDLTINALFYNINEDKVEDFTGRGLEDLKNGYIRTPLAALNTFTDDPLRVLRVFRFAARYNFTIDPEIHEAIRDPSVLEHLRHKVSRERIGKEVEPALEHPNCVIYLNYLHAAGLLEVILDVAGKPVDPVSQEKVTEMINHNSMIWNKITNVADTHKQLLLKANNDEPKTTRLYLMLSSLLYGFDQVKYAKSALYCEHFIKEGLKLKNKYSDDIRTILCGATNISQTLSKTTQEDLKLPAFAQYLGILIRELGNLYPLSLLLLLSLPKPPQNLSLLIEQLNAHKLAHFHDVKPLINGTDAMKELGVSGKDVKPILDAALKWQVIHREGTKDELLAFLKQQFIKK
jgi:tRNA nucleotidyltransferase/poly(A) polymerase